MFAFPLGVGVVRLGALTFSRGVPGDLHPRDGLDAVALGHVATHLLLELEHSLEPGRLPDRLSDVLDQRAPVHQATGMVAAQLDLDVAAALGRLRAHAWSHDRAIGEVARDVIIGRLRFEGEQAR